MTTLFDRSTFPSRRSDGLMFRLLLHIVTLGSLTQMLVGGMAAMGSTQLMPLHAAIARVVLASGLAAMFLGFVNRTRTYPHSVIVAMLALIQYALGEMHLKQIHMGMGMLVTIVAIWTSWTVIMRQRQSQQPLPPTE